MTHNAVVQVAYIESQAQGATQHLLTLEWQPQLTALQLLQQSGLLARLGNQPLQVGVFGEQIGQPEHYIMQAGDRLEIYRPLSCDPKAVRRKRAAANPVGRFKRKLL